jgi:hypothetical protein
MRLWNRSEHRQAQRTPEPGAAWSPQPRSDFMERLEIIRREIEARPQNAPPAQVGETAQAGRHHREFTRATLAMEKALDALGCRAALAVLRDSGLTGGYVEGPLAIRQEYLAAPGGPPLYPPCAAVILRKPGYATDPPHPRYKAWYAGVWACQGKDRTIHLLVGQAEEPTDCGLGERINIPEGERVLYNIPDNHDSVQAEIERRLLDWAREESLRSL